MQNYLVVAGPGAGKTELLAQRASYLLDTGTCAAPKRILAISFKRDAASNIEKRVRERCGDLANLFDSFTFDAFFKSLVDRFRHGLIDSFRPTADYTIDVSGEIRCTWQDAARKCLSAEERQTLFSQPGREVERAIRDAVFQDYMGAKGPIHQAALKLCRYYLSGRKPSLVDFGMLPGLALVILRDNPKLVTALRATYAYLFLDEFQDTTRMQYRVVQTVFRGSSTIVTAVGDNKQRIMVWAGALKNVFADFRQNFSAQVVPLIRNYRAAPRLIRILNVLSKSVDLRAADQTHPQGDVATEEGVCRCSVFGDHHDEAESVADEIARLVGEGIAIPSDICILTRQTPADYTVHVSKKLAEKGIKSRVENERQDRMAEPVVQFLLQVLTLAAKGRCIEAWDTVRNFTCHVWDVYSDSGSDRRVDDDLTALLSNVRQRVRSVLPTDKIAVVELVIQIIGVADRSELTTAFPQYAQGDYLEQLLGFVVDEIVKAGERYHGWDEVIADVLGLDSVPIMTIHKSKGLEYHSVFFVGLEDQAFWGYRNNPDEETCAFFVAFSRAKKQVFFTSCEVRARGSKPREGTTRVSIESFYQALEEAGVTVEYPT